MLIYVADMFANQYEGGAELTTEAIIDASMYPGNKVNSQQVNLHPKGIFIFFHCA